MAIRHKTFEDEIARAERKLSAQKDLLHRFEHEHLTASRNSSATAWAEYAVREEMESTQREIDCLREQAAMESEPQQPINEDDFAIKYLCPENAGRPRRLLAVLDYVKKIAAALV